MTSDEIAFVEEIRSAPDDLTPRLIYADFLEDAGDPRGELIRVQCELSQTRPGDAARPALFDRERALLDEFGEEWLAPVRSLGVESVSRSSFHCGLLERIRIPATTFLQHSEQLFERLPALSCLELRNSAPVARELAEFELPEQISTLDLSANQLDPAALEVLTAAKWTPNIWSLSLQMNQLKDDVFNALRGGWPALRQLKAGMNQMGPAGLRSVSELAARPVLESLDLRMNPIAYQGLGRLATAGLTRLRVLNLVRCEIQSIRVLIDEDRWPDLTSLSLRNNHIPASELEALEQTDFGQRLSEFDVRNN